MINHTPIFITGCRRSGSSMVSAILYLHGVWTGNFGTEKIRKLSFFNKGLWQEGFSQFFPFEKMPDKDAVAKHIESVLVHRGFRGGYWLMKNYDLVFFQDILTDIFPQCFFVHVRRGKDDILKSLMSTYPLCAQKSEAEWKNHIDLVYNHLDKFQTVGNVFTVYPDKFFKNNFNEIKIFIERKLKLDWQGRLVTKLFEHIKTQEEKQCPELQMMI